MKEQINLEQMLTSIGEYVIMEFEAVEEIRYEAKSVGFRGVLF